MFFPNCQVAATPSDPKEAPFWIFRNSKGQFGYLSAYISYNFWIIVDPSFPPSDARLKTFVRKHLPSLDELFKELLYLHTSILKRRSTERLYALQPSALPTDLILKFLFYDALEQASKYHGDLKFQLMLTCMLEINFSAIRFVAHEMLPSTYCTVLPFNYSNAATPFLTKLDDSYTRDGFINPACSSLKLSSKGAFIGIFDNKAFVAYFVVSEEGLYKAAQWLMRASPVDRDRLHQFQLTSYSSFFASIKPEIIRVAI